MNKTCLLAAAIALSLAGPACVIVTDQEPKTPSGETPAPETTTPPPGGETPATPDPGATTEPGTPDPGGETSPPASSITLYAGKLRLPGNITFETGQATLKPDSGSEAVLMEVKKYLESQPEVELLRIEGHTDIDGDPQQNLDLSLQRAQTVQQWLVDNGIAADRLTVIGFGPLYPVGNNTDAEGKAMNRRIEFHVAIHRGRPLGGKDPKTGGRFGGKVPE